MEIKNRNIAIDGPSASGKSTVAKIIARRLGSIYVDTGAMYRAYTLATLNKHIDPKNEEESNKLIGKIKISFDQKNNITLDGENVAKRIRDNDVADNVSYIASYKQIRLFLVDLQREIAKGTNVVMDGRDIGTYVLPDAFLKIYQIADVKTRGERRYNENLIKGIKCTYEECLENLQKRDYIDSHRAFAPLKKADDAITLDTTNMEIDEVVDKIISLYREKDEQE
ncbi:MAG: (d)CMP kinase [Bacilli bacterium]